MKRRAVGLILFVLGLGLVREASAQRATKGAPYGTQARTAHVGRVPAGPLPLLPRFWQLADSAERTDAAEVFNQYLQQFIQYPELARKADVGGVIYALLTVLPDGHVRSVAITRRDLSSDSPPVKAVAALDAELLRVAWQLRFKPMLAPANSTARADTVVDVTDITERNKSTAVPENNDVTDVTDVTEASDGSNQIPVDTVTINYRFALH